MEHPLETYRVQSVPILVCTTQRKKLVIKNGSSTRDSLRISKINHTRHVGNVINSLPQIEYMHFFVRTSVQEWWCRFHTHTHTHKRVFPHFFKSCTSIAQSKKVKKKSPFPGPPPVSHISHAESILAPTMTNALIHPSRVHDQRNQGFQGANKSSHH
jgi:hypothetical protein